MSHYFALVISILIGIAGQLCLKVGAVNVSSAKWFILQPYLIVGLGLYFIAALSYIYALTKIPVSVAFPSVSISYVAVAFLAHLLWKEQFGIAQMLALLLISSGIILLWSR